MATKRISELTLRSDFDETCNVPVDDATQSYRTTGQQILDFVLGVGNIARGTVVSISNASSPWTQVDDADLVLVDGTSGVTITPIAAASGNSGKIVVVRKTDSTAGVVTITGVTTLRYQNESVILISSGSAWLVLNRYIPLNKQRIVLSGGATHGSTNTKIRRFTTVEENASTSGAMTLTQSSTNGDSITINEAGLYSIAYQDGGTGVSSGSVFGISVNSNQLTTNFFSITETHKLIGNTGSPTAGGPAAMAVTTYLNATDVVRFHTTGSSPFDATAVGVVRAMITKVS